MEITGIPKNETDYQRISVMSLREHRPQLGWWVSP